MIDFFRKLFNTKSHQAKLAKEKVAEGAWLCEARVKKLGLNVGDKVRNSETGKVGIFVRLRLFHGNSYEVVAKEIEDGSTFFFRISVLEKVEK
jgi:translation elongation factor EF-G